LKKRKTSASTPDSPLVGRLSLHTAAGALAGERRIRLLEAIEQHGSITRAAKAVPVSYKAAWDALDAMNNLAEHPLVERSAGGRQGGGTRLTEHGRRLIAMYRAIEREQQDTLDRLGPELARGSDRTAPNTQPTTQQFQTLIKRLAVRTSARNQFVGNVAALRESTVSSEVAILLDANTQIVAGVTRESAQALGLAVGSPVLALVKASSVLLVAGEGMPTSARNHLTGTVSRIAAGAISAEVTLALPGGRTVTAAITRDSLERLGLAQGRSASALFKASSVILVALD
jgi:molybdate transport system regulatory protein